MDIRVFTPENLPIALGAVRAVDPLPTRDQDRFLRSVARLNGAELDPRALPVPSLAETARAVVDQHQRKRLVELAVIMATVDGFVLPVPTANVTALGRALGVDEPEMHNLRRIAGDHRLLARADLTRRVMGRFVGEVWQDERFKGIARFVGPLFKASDDVATGAKYRALEKLPKDSLGYALFEHYRSNGFAFPGERGGLPEKAVFHDLGHVLSGYRTDPDGEIQQAAFQAGFVRNAGFMFLYFGVVQFHLGIKITPAADAEIGYFDVEKVMTALARGAACKVDLNDHWNFWPLLPRPLAEVRSELGVPPLEPRGTRRSRAA